MAIPSSYRNALPYMVRHYAHQLGVTIEVKGSHAYSTSDSIVIPELDLSDPTLARLTYGFLAHEAGHLRYSDFDQCAQLDNEVLLRIVNSLEDGRIEYLMARGFIGVYENLELLNQCLMRDSHQALLHPCGQPWTKLDLLCIALVLVSHEHFNNYPGVSVLKRAYLDELNYLMNEAALQEIVATTWHLRSCHDTSDVIAVAAAIYDILQQPNTFVPNFTRFAQHYQCTSQFDLNNCRALAEAYGQTFVLPSSPTAPHSVASVTSVASAEPMARATGLQATLTQLCERYCPQFLAPREPGFMPKSNSAALLERWGAPQLTHAQALSDLSAGHAGEAARLFARGKAQRAKSAAHLGRALKELIPSVSTDSALGQSVSAQLQARCAGQGNEPAALLGAAPPKITAADAADATMPLELSALQQALSFDPEHFDLGAALALAAATPVPFFGVSPEPSPYQGPYRTRCEWGAALSLGQKLAHQAPRAAAPSAQRNAVLPPDWVALEQRWDDDSAERYWRLAQRDLSSIRGAAHLTAEELSKLGLKRVTPSLELCTRLILEAWAYPTLEQPLLPWLDLRNLPEPVKTQLELALTFQDERLSALKNLRTPLRGLVAPQECYRRTAHAVTTWREFLALVVTAPSLMELIRASNDVRAHSDLWPAIQYRQERGELVALAWGNNPKALSPLCAPLLPEGVSPEQVAALDRSYVDIAAHLSTYYKQHLLRQRRVLKFQRQEAILQEQGLLNPHSLDLNPSLNPAHYCQAAGHTYERPLLQRALIAKHAVLHNCPSTIAATVAPDHFQALTTAQSKYGPAPAPTALPAKTAAATAAPAPSLRAILEQLYKTPQLTDWDAAPAAFNGAVQGADQGALASAPAGAPESAPESAPAGAPESAPAGAQKGLAAPATKVEVLQLLLSAAPTSVTRAQQDEFMAWLKRQTPQEHWGHPRDPRLECTFNDALREYWYVRSEYCPEGEAATLPELEPARVIERFAQQQELSAHGTEGWQVTPHTNKDQDLSTVPSYYQLDLKQFVADVKRKYDPLRRQLRRRLQSYLECQQEYGRRGHTLDARRAQRLPLGETRIFQQRTQLADHNTVLHLLVDCSGSMGQCATHGAATCTLADTRIYQACAAALTLGLALDHLAGLDLMITFFPHSRADQPYFNVISIGEHVSAHPERLWHPPFGGTPMDQALNYAAESVLRCAATRAIIVILTDGQPNNPAALRAEVSRAQDSGIEIYGIGINESQGQQYFEHFYNLTDFSDLTYELCTLVSHVFKLPEVA